MHPKHHWRKTIYRWLEKDDTLLGRLVNISIAILILLNVIAVIVESMLEVYLAYESAFRWFDWISVLLFTIEYLLRLWVAPENPRFAKHQSPRWAWARSGMAIIDFLAIAPFYFSLIFPVDTRVLRVLRLLRIFKLARYSSAMELLVTVIRKETGSFASALFIMLMLIVFAASAIYVVERDAQPEQFGSIPAALWWATVTLTTVGYGDVVPITVLGKALGMLITVGGLGMEALPAGILASGFSRELELRRETFRNEVEEAMSDGRLDTKERAQLRKVRRALGLSEEEAKQLIEGSELEFAERFQRCPHCGHALSKHKP